MIIYGRRGSRASLRDDDCRCCKGKWIHNLEFKSFESICEEWWTKIFILWRIFQSPWGIFQSPWRIFQSPWRIFRNTWRKTSDFWRTYCEDIQAFLKCAEEFLMQCEEKSRSYEEKSITLEESWRKSSETWRMLKKFFRGFNNGECTLLTFWRDAGEWIYAKLHQNNDMQCVCLACRCESLYEWQTNVSISWHLSLRVMFWRG